MAIESVTVGLGEGQEITEFKEQLVNAIRAHGLFPFSSFFSSFPFFFFQIVQTVVYSSLLSQYIFDIIR